MSDPMLPFDDDPIVRLKPDTTEEIVLPDADARRLAVDPSHNVILEASAGTGKTRVLVERYVNLLRAGVEPDHILAITFTRKAAAEMRQRIIERLKEASRLSQFDAGRWRDLKERLGDIAVSTIDAFCLSLLREFPLEADVDPGFDLADATEVPRLVGESLDQAFRICRAAARDDEDVALVFAQLGERRLRAGIAALLDRRLVAPHALRRFLQKGPRDLTAGRRLRIGGCGTRHAVFMTRAAASRRFSMTARSTIRSSRCSRTIFETPRARRLASSDDARPDASGVSRARRSPARLLSDPGGQAARTELRRHRLHGGRLRRPGCLEASPRRRVPAGAAGGAARSSDFRRDLNAVMSRGVWRIFAVALRQYQHTLDAHALLDFSGVLERAVQLLKEMDEFAESRLRLEARHRHVLVDEFQDTSRAQWELVRQLVKSWGEGFGAAADAIPPSIFIVGDRKQSIYGFRDADVAVVDDAAGFIEALRPDGLPPQAITVSFPIGAGILAVRQRSVSPPSSTSEPAAASRRDAFRYGDQDRFPVRLKPDDTPATDSNLDSGSRPAVSRP